MSTLLDIKNAAAAILERSPLDFTVNGQDLWLLAANQVRKTAELEHDFEFNRKLVTVTVNGTIGGDLGQARDENGDLVEVKTVLDVGLQDDNLNLIPVIWTTVAESLERQRLDSRFGEPRYRTDNWLHDGPAGFTRFTFSGDKIFRWPKTDQNQQAQDYPLWLEVYSFADDWTSADLAQDTITLSGVEGTPVSPDVTGTFKLTGYIDTGILTKVYVIRTNDADALLYNGGGSNYYIRPFGFTDYWSGGNSVSDLTGDYEPTGAGVAGSITVSQTATPATTDIWTTKGQQFLLWATIVQLNKLFKVFVPRQEGNLPPPTDQADSGLQALVDWDVNKFEQFRRHNR